MMTKYVGVFTKDQVDRMTSWRVQSVQKWWEQMNFILPTQVPPTHRILCPRQGAKVLILEQVQLVRNLEVR